MINKCVALILSFFAVAACAEEGELYEYWHNPVLRMTSKAQQFLGAHEVEDRALLKVLLGVDPVETEWCAAFVNSMLILNELPTSENKLLAKSFLDWGDPVFVPQQGDIVVFERGTEEWQGHVGFYLSSIILEDKEYYFILGGNQNNSISIKMYPASRVLGIRRLEQIYY